MRSIHLSTILVFLLSFILNFPIFCMRLSEKERKMKSYYDQCSRKMKIRKEMGVETWGLRALLQTTLKKSFIPRSACNFCYHFVFMTLCVFIKCEKYLFYFILRSVIKCLMKLANFYIYGNCTKEGMVRRMSVFIVVHK